MASDALALDDAILRYDVGFVLRVESGEGENTRSEMRGVDKRVGKKAGGWNSENERKVSRVSAFPS